MTPGSPLHLLQAWKVASERLEIVKTEEANLRLAAVAVVSTPGKEEGTERVMMPSGFEAEIKHVLNYTVSNKNGEVKHLQSIMPADMFADLFRIKYEISISAYRKLSPAQQEVINYCLTIKPGMPTLELKPPAADRII